MAVIGGMGEGASGISAGVTAPTGAGAVAFSGAAVACAGVSSAAVVSYSHNVNVLFSMSGDKGTGSTDYSSWNQGSFASSQESLEYHFNKHGAEVNAKDIDQYLRKAEGFMNNLKGAKRSYIDGTVEGVIRYIKNGKYVDVAPNGTIVSFGAR